MVSDSDRVKLRICLISLQKTWECPVGRPYLREKLDDDKKNLFDILVKCENIQSFGNKVDTNQVGHELATCNARKYICVVDGVQTNKLKDDEYALTDEERYQVARSILSTNMASGSLLDIALKSIRKKFLIEDTMLKKKEAQLTEGKKRKKKFLWF